MLVKIPWLLVGRRHSAVDIAEWENIGDLQAYHRYLAIYVQDYISATAILVHERACKVMDICIQL